VAGVRSDKLKAEAAAKAAARGGGAAKKKTLNVGRSGGAAGLDDFVYDDPLDDDVDFM
jgi:translation initiation factor 3 subunit J